MSKNKIILSLGGSIIIPEEIDCQFLANFKTLIEKFIKKDWQFFIVTGGGKIARKYAQAAAKITKVPNEDLDWLGIHATRLNAHLLRTIFRKHAYPKIFTNPNKKYANMNHPVVIGAGYRPGWSTDYVSTLLARRYKVKKVLNLSNIRYVYDKDPNKHSDAKPLKQVSWLQMKKMVGSKWVPGSNLPFDPIATKLGAKLNLEVVTMYGKDLKNLENYLLGKEFKGTIIHNN